jgi:hypothetical protein
MIETTVDNQHNLTTHKCSGNLTEKELLDTIKSFYNGSPTLNTLWNFSDASISSISTETVKKIFPMVLNLGSRRQSGKSAIVAPSDLEYGMARMFQTMAEINDFPFVKRVFRSMEEAKQWLFQGQSSSFSLFFTECSITGSIFTRRLSFCSGKSIRDYFMGKSGAFHGELI